MIARPPDVAPFEGAVADTVYPAFTNPVDRHDVIARPFRGFDAVLDGPHYTVLRGEFTAGDVLDIDEDSAYTKQGTYNSFVLYNRNRKAVAVADGTLVVGTAAPNTPPARIVKRVIDAGTGTTRYVDKYGGVSRVTTALSNAAYGVVVPVDGAPVTRPESGLFATERGYGIGLRLGDETTTRTVVRTFQGTPPDGATAQLTGETTTEGSTVHATTEMQTDELSLLDLAPAVRDVTAGMDAAFPSVIEQDDGSYDVYGSAFQFAFAPFNQRDLSFPAGATVRFHMTSKDVLHGFAIKGLSVDRTLVPGEVEDIELTVPAEPGTYTVEQSRYVGAGTDFMSADFEVTGSSTATFSGWMDGAMNYEGTVVDLRGQSTATVEVGAGSSSLGFAPPAIRISPGTTVEWEWTGKGGSHNVHAKHGASFESDFYSDSGIHFSHTFEESAVVKYQCDPHAPIGARGVVDIRES